MLTSQSSVREIQAAWAEARRNAVNLAGYPRFEVLVLDAEGFANEFLPGCSFDAEGIATWIREARGVRGAAAILLRCVVPQVGETHSIVIHL